MQIQCASSVSNGVIPKSIVHVAFICHKLSTFNLKHHNCWPLWKDAQQPHVMEMVQVLAEQTHNCRASCNEKNHI